jgi:hypothetical protein
MMAWEALSFVLTLLLTVLALLFVTLLRDHAVTRSRVTRLEAEIAEFERVQEEYQRLAIRRTEERDAVLRAPLSFDRQTRHLILLAASNSEEHEARNAAVLACKRLASRVRVSS